MFFKRMLQKLYCLFFCLSFITSGIYGQDKVYTHDGRVLLAKVTEVGPREIKYRIDNNGPVYVIYMSQVDSIIYESGKIDIFGRHGVKKNDHINTGPYRHNISGDIFGLIATSVSLSYELKVAADKIGLRIPLYIGFNGGGIAGQGTFSNTNGVFYYHPAFYDSYSSYPLGGKGFCMATGFNPKFYLIKHKIVRPFIGPEIDAGVSVDRYDTYSNYYGTNQNGKTSLLALGAMIKFGLQFTPRADAFFITVDGGVGTSDFIGNNNPVEWAGLWHVGFALGGGFNTKKLFKNQFE
jgi:hypothetical protein